VPEAVLWLGETTSRRSGQQKDAAAAEASLTKICTDRTSALVPIGRGDRRKDGVHRGRCFGRRPAPMNEAIGLKRLAAVTSARRTSAFCLLAAISAQGSDGSSGSKTDLEPSRMRARSRNFRWRPKIVLGSRTRSGENVPKAVVNLHKAESWRGNRNSKTKYGGWSEHERYFPLQYHMTRLQQSSLAARSRTSAIAAKLPRVYQAAAKRRSAECTTITPGDVRGDRRRGRHCRRRIRR
jgi:hypothetical protein